MTYLSKIAFIIGLLLALLFGFLRALGSTAWLVPWLLVGGAGIVCGLLYVAPSERKLTLLILIGLVVALSAILLQDFNPWWLTDIVFWVRVFFAHALLSFSFIHLFKPIQE
jgi:hypothetical protein